MSNTQAPPTNESTESEAATVERLDSMGSMIYAVLRAETDGPGHAGAVLVSVMGRIASDIPNQQTRDAWMFNILCAANEFSEKILSKESA